MTSDWECVTLEQIADSRGYGLVDGPFGSNLPASAYTESGIPVIRGSNLSLGPNKFCSDTFVYVSEETAEKLSRSLCKADDIVFTKKGTLGQTGLVPKDNRHAKYLISSNQMKLTVDRDIADPKFVYYYVSSAQSIEKIIQDSESTGVPKTNVTYLKTFEIPLPPLPEQKAIAHILGSLDDKIELNRKMNATLEAMAQALFKSWFVDFDPVIDNALAAGNPIPEELAPRAEIRKTPLGERSSSCVTSPKDGAGAPSLPEFPAAFQFTDELGYIPEGWDVKPLADQVSLTMGQSPSSEHYNKDRNGLPFHQGVTNYGVRFPTNDLFTTEGNRHAKSGDILFSVRAPVGRINIANCNMVIGRGLSALRHKQDHQSFLVYFLKHTFQKEDSIGSGTIFNAVNKKEMEKIPLIVAPDSVTTAFDLLADSWDSKIASNASEADTLTKLRDTLLPKLISGELRISN